jgi:flagellin-like protein
MRKLKNKKAVSPVIATILLILIAIIIAILIFLWAKSFIKESIKKMDKSIDNICSEVKIETFAEEDSFGFRNTGNVPIYAVNLELSSEGDSEVIKIDLIKLGNPGMTYVFTGNDGDGEYNALYSSHESVKIIPVLIGKNKNGVVKQYTCNKRNAFIV